MKTRLLLGLWIKRVKMKEPIKGLTRNTECDWVKRPGSSCQWEGRDRHKEHTGMWPGSESATSGGVDLTLTN